MFGLFDGLFGDNFLGKAAESALGMCLLDEMEQEERAAALLSLEDENDWEF